MSVHLSSLQKSPMYHTVSYTVSSLSNSCERVSATGKEQREREREERERERDERERERDEREREREREREFKIIKRERERDERERERERERSFTCCVSIVSVRREMWTDIILIVCMVTNCHLSSYGVTSYGVIHLWQWFEEGCRKPTLGVWVIEAPFLLMPITSRTEDRMLINPVSTFRCGVPWTQKLRSPSENKQDNPELWKAFFLKPGIGRKVKSKETVGNSWTVLKVILGHKYNHNH